MYAPLRNFLSDISSRAVCSREDFFRNKDKKHQGFLKYWVIAIQNSFYFSTFTRFIALVKRHTVQCTVYSTAPQKSNRYILQIYVLYISRPVVFQEKEPTFHYCIGPPGGYCGKDFFFLPERILRSGTKKGVIYTLYSMREGTYRSEFTTVNTRN